MKNKLIYLMLALFANFSFSTMAFSEPLTTEKPLLIEEPVTSQGPFFENYVETLVADFECDRWNTYRYVSLGVGPIIFIPNIGVGYRARQSEFGWDTAFSFSTIGSAHQLGAHLVGHYYLSPLRRNSTYLGLGIMGSAIFAHHRKAGVTFSPDFVVGKEFGETAQGRRFIEMHLAYPTAFFDGKKTHAVNFPFVYIKYGIAF